MVSFPSPRSQKKSPKPARAVFCRGRQPHHITFSLNWLQLCFTRWAPPCTKRTGSDLENKISVPKLVKFSAQEAGIGVFPDIYTRGIWSFTLSGRNLLMLKIWPGLPGLFRSYEWLSVDSSPAESDEACAAVFWARGCSTTHTLQDLCSVGYEEARRRWCEQCLPSTVDWISLFCFQPSSGPKHFSCSDRFWPINRFKTSPALIQLEISFLLKFIYLKYYLIINGKLFFKWH